MNENRQFHGAILHSREWKGNNGLMATITVLDLATGKVLVTNVEASVLASSGIEFVDEKVVYNVQLEEIDSMRSRIVGFEKTDLTYELKLVD